MLPLLLSWQGPWTCALQSDLIHCQLCKTGIGNTKQGLHPIQACLATANGSQCGFCSPGFVMAMYAKLRATGGTLSEAELQETLSGNLWCRPLGCPVAMSVCLI